MEERTARIELHLRGEEVSGRVVAEGRDDVAFSGWIAMLAALDALVERPDRGSLTRG